MSIPKIKIPSMFNEIADLPIIYGLGNVLITTSTPAPPSPSPSPSPDIHDVLVKAYNSLSRGMWTRDWAGCIMRHIATAAGMTAGMESTVVGTKIGILCARACGFVSPSEAMTWNDNTARTKEEVLARLQIGITATAPPPAMPTLEIPEAASEERELVAA